MIKDNKEVLPIYLKSILLENVKCFGPRQKLSLFDKGKPKLWTVILGDNGTGKSTILQAIAIALSQSDEDAKHFNLFNFAREKNKQGYCEIAISNPVKNNTSKYSEASDILKSSHLTINGPDLKRFRIPVLGYGSYRRLGNKGLSNYENSFQCKNLFDESSSLLNAEDWLLTADYQHVKSKVKFNQYDKVKKILLKILREEVSDIEIREKRFGFGAYFKTRYGWVNLKNLSTGYKSLITWMIDLSNWLLNLYPNSKDPLKEQAIVLVDEIDLHLHVSLQKKLVNFLQDTFPKAQFIVTAHSPLIVQGSENENIIFLEKNNDHVLIKDNPIQVQNWRVDQILKSGLFGLESSRSDKTEVKMKRRYQLIQKETLTNAEQKEMNSLDKFIRNVPLDENIEDIKANEIIKNAAEILKNLKK